MKMTEKLKLTGRIILVAFLCSLQYLRAEIVDITAVEGVTITADYTRSSVPRLIDGDVNTDYNFKGYPNAIVLKAPSSYVLKSFTLTSSATRAADYDPRSWELFGSVDGVSWVSLRVSTVLSFSERGQTKTFSFTGGQSYMYFRFTINSVKAADGPCAIAEWRLYGEEKPVPQAPTNARLNPLAYNQVKLSWRDNSNNESQFEIQRTLNGVDYVTVGIAPANATSYIDTRVNASTPYIYRVCAMLAGVRSAYSVSNAVITPEFKTLTSLTGCKAYTAASQYQDSPDGEDVGKAFDDDSATKFLCRRSSTWMQVEFNQPYKVEQYSITSANDAPDRDPKKWNLEASVDGVNWVVLDTKEAQAFDARFQKRYFDVQNTVEYKFYRLNIILNHGEGLTQVADWLLYAAIPAEPEVINPSIPKSFTSTICSFHLIRLNWTDVSNETGYRIERYDNGSTTVSQVYEVPVNNTQFFAYALQPETEYTFKLYALNADQVSEAVVVTSTTPRKEWMETWNVKLWIFDDPITVKKVKEIGNVAFYMPEENTVNDVNELYYGVYAEQWDYVWDTYGDVLSDPRLYVLLFPQKDGGGIASIFDYRSADGKYTNAVYIKAHQDWFKENKKEGYIYDVMAHEICHIVEGVGGGYNGSMFYPVWKDSKWAEIFQYDIFKNTGSPRAATWHQAYTTSSNGDDFPNPDKKSHWYRDFFYPTYAKYGQTELLKNFWKLQGIHYKKKNGDFQGTSENPGGRGNLGEFIHFWSGAAGVDVKPDAIKAFGWNEQFEMWLQKAKRDYPGVVYSEPEAQLEGESSKPADVRAKAISTTEVYLDWVCALDKVDYLEIERSQNGVDFTKISTVNKYEISYTDNVPAAGEYYYRIVAKSEKTQITPAVSENVFVNTLVSGMDQIAYANVTFDSLIDHLSDYPENIVTVYSVVGQIVYNAPYYQDDLIRFLSTTLGKGIYIVSVNTDGACPLRVQGKIFVP